MTLTFNILEGLNSEYEPVIDDVAELVPGNFRNDIDYTSYLCEIAKQTTTEGKQKAWKNRSLARCLYLAAPSLPSLITQAGVPEVSTAYTTRRRWAKIASLLNSIVADLLKFWGNEAYRVYKALVGELGARANL